MRSHEQSVADCQNRCAVDYYTIKDGCSLSNESAEEWPGKNLSWIGRAPPTCEHGELTSRRGKNFPRKLNILVDKLEFSGRNPARGRRYVRFAHQAIRHSRCAVFL